MGVQQTAKQTPDTKAGYAAARTTANSALANMPGNVKLGHGGTYDAQGNITFGEWTLDEAARRMNPYTDEVIDKTLSERAERTKKTLEEIKAATNVEAMRRNEGIRRAADYVIEHSTIEEK